MRLYIFCVYPEGQRPLLLFLRVADGAPFIFKAVFRFGALVRQPIKYCPKRFCHRWRGIWSLRIRYDEKICVSVAYKTLWNVRNVSAYCYRLWLPYPRKNIATAPVVAGRKNGGSLAMMTVSWFWMNSVLFNVNVTRISITEALKSQEIKKFYGLFPLQDWLMKTIEDLFGDAGK